MHTSRRFVLTGFLFLPRDSLRYRSSEFSSIFGRPSPLRWASVIAQKLDLRYSNFHDEDPNQNPNENKNENQNGNPDERSNENSNGDRNEHENGGPIEEEIPKDSAQAESSRIAAEREAAFPIKEARDSLLPAHAEDFEDSYPSLDRKDKRMPDKDSNRARQGYHVVTTEVMQANVVNTLMQSEDL